MTDTFAFDNNKAYFGRLEVKATISVLHAFEVLIQHIQLFEHLTEKCSEMQKSLFV